MPIPKTERGMKSLLERACVNLFQKQPDIFNQTHVTGQTEWNLSQHLAPEIRRLLGPGLAHDIDVTKKIAGNRRPDIIFHTRGRFDEDYLVIELKFEGSAAGILSDTRKIQRWWFMHPLNYKFGATINLHRGRLAEVVVLVNPNHDHPQE